MGLWGSLKVRALCSMYRASHINAEIRLQRRQQQHYRQNLVLIQVIIQEKIEFQAVASPVEAVLKTFADGAEVSRVSHNSAVERVVLQIYR